MFLANDKRCARRSLTTFLLVFLVSWLVHSKLYAGTQRAEGELIIKFRGTANSGEIQRALRGGRIHLRRHLQTGPMVLRGHPGLVLASSEFETETALLKLRNDPAVEYVERNVVYTHQSVSNDPFAADGSLWGMYGDLTTPGSVFGSQAAEAWNAGYVGTNSVYVAVVDDGMFVTHPDLAPNVWVNPFDPPDGVDNDGNGYADDVNGWDFRAETNIVYTAGDAHGTHVAGTIGAKGNNGIGVAGVNWNVTLIPVKFMTGGSGTTMDAVEAIDYCTDLKTRHGLNLVAINASWGGTGYSQSLHDAVIRAAKAGILFVAAAGNSTNNNDTLAFYPANLDTSLGTLNESAAAYNSVISVAAIDSAGNLATFSDWGSRTVHLGAPGVSIFSTYPDQGYAWMGGTSMAAPHVTGAAALYASTHPGAAAADIRAALLGSVLPTASLAGKTTTGGRLNLSSIITPPSPASAPAISPATQSILAESLPNGVVDPDELVTLNLALLNTSPVATTNLTATLQSSSAVLSPSGAQNYGALVNGGSASRPFTFTTSGTCGQPINLVLALHDGALDLGTVTFSVQLGQAVTNLFENFDSVTRPALPSGWTVSRTGAGQDWATVLSSTNTAPNAVFAPDTSTSSDNKLTSPAVHVRSASARLSFAHSFAFEPDWDGGVLEISINGSAFTDIVTAGGVFLQNGYNRRLSASTTPLTSRLAWNANSGGFITSVVQLPATCANKDVQIRWRAGADSSTGGLGWYIDSISLVDAFTCSLPDQSIFQGSSASWSFPLGNAVNETGLTLSAASSNNSLVPNANIVLSGAGSSRTATVTPLAGQTGVAKITITVKTDSSTTFRTFSLIVNPVNQAPSFVKGADQLAAQDSGTQTVAGWASAINPGAGETQQTVDFLVTADNPSLFSALPSISPTGMLAYTPASHARGTATITVQLHDNGGTANGGSDTSPAQTFVITVGLSTDADSDGLPDDFELAYGLNPNDSADAASDWDGDGFSTLDEYLAGTSPHDASSFPQITALAAQTGGVKISFRSEQSRPYALEFNDNYPSSSWQTIVGTLSATGNSLEGMDSSSVSANKRVYRVRYGAVPSAPAGFVRLPLLGNSDTLVSMPFARPPAVVGVVQTVSGNVVQLKGAPGWSDNQWVYSGGQTNSYYLQITSGAFEGDYFTITANGADTVMLDLQGASVSGLLAGDRVEVVPYWTLGTIFPAGKGIQPSAAPGSRATEILLPDVAAVGVNVSASRTYYFWNGAWRQVGAGAANKNDDALLPDMFFWVRHNQESSTELFASGSIVSTKWRFPVRRNAGLKQDNIVALPRITGLTLNSSGLLESGAFLASPSPGGRLDELLLFDNSVAAKNKSAAATFYYWNGAWRQVGAGATDVGTSVILNPGAGCILRSSPGASTVWTNTVGY